MKGIREAALTKDEPEIFQKKKHKSFDFDRYDRDYGYGSYEKQDSLFDSSRKTKFEEADGQLTIKLSIPNEKIGAVADEYSSRYSHEATMNKAEELALKEIDKLAKDDWQEKYSYEITDCMALWSSVDLEILLLKN